MLLGIRLWAAAALSVLLTAAAVADKLDDVKTRGNIVGVSDTTPPFSFRKPGEAAVTGYDIDLVKGVAKRMGVALEMIPVSSAERIPLSVRCNRELAGHRPLIARAKPGIPNRGRLS